MLTEETINRIAQQLQTNNLNIKREYFQHLFLSYFYQQTKASDIYFKGGTALRVIYQSPRFSEDLDFNVKGLDVKTIEEIILDTLSQIEKENVKVNLQESKQTSGGYFATLDFDGDILINLQISFRKGKSRGEVVTISNDFMPPYTIMALTSDQLVEEKVRALVERKKPRDFYDLYFILRDSKLRACLPKDYFKEVLQIIQNTKVNFEFELKQFLPRSHWMVIRDFKSVLRREIS